MDDHFYSNIVAEIPIPENLTLQEQHEWAKRTIERYAKRVSSAVSISTVVTNSSRLTGYTVTAYLKNERFVFRTIQPRNDETRILITLKTEPSTEQDCLNKLHCKEFVAEKKYQRPLTYNPFLALSNMVKH